jgi:soluble cytochrome b562
MLLVPALLVAQAKPAPKAPSKPAMPHDMSKMGADTGMKHDMAGMKHDMSAMGQGMGMGDMKSGWAELDAFHSLLMSTWHPALKDSLTMARSLAPQLAASAEKWAKSKGPAACDNATARKALPGIVADAKTYAKVVADKGNDAAVKAALKKVHDGFEIAGKPCMQAAMKVKGGMGMGAMMGRKTGWKEFDALHTLVMNVSMAANKGDLKPAREKGAELAKAADAWQASKGPASCDNAAARKGMPKAVADLKAIATLARSQGNDDALKAAINQAHDSFRPVAQPCMMGGMAKASDANKPAPAMDHSKMDHSKMVQPQPKKP